MDGKTGAGMSEWSLHSYVAFIYFLHLCSISMSELAYEWRKEFCVAMGLYTHLGYFFEYIGIWTYRSIVYQTIHFDR